jgi:hypothetical protein
MSSSVSLYFLFPTTEYKYTLQSVLKTSIPCLFDDRNVLWNQYLSINYIFIESKSIWGAGTLFQSTRTVFYLVSLYAYIVKMFSFLFSFLISRCVYFRELFKHLWKEFLMFELKKYIVTSAFFLYCISDEEQFSCF